MVPADAIDEFYTKDWMQSSVGDRTQLTDMIIKWALSCKMSYDIVKEAHETAIKMEDALTKVREDLDTFTIDAGANFRFFGDVCQNVKVSLFEITCFSVLI